MKCFYLLNILKNDKIYELFKDVQYRFLAVEEAYQLWDTRKG